MRFLWIAATLITATTPLYGDGMDEINEWRRRSGLRPFIEDPAMTRFAQMKAKYRAARNLRNGHQGPQAPAGWREGTGEASSSWGWLTCESESDFTYAGAAVCLGPDGTRFMVLVCRGGSGRALLPRNRSPVHSTAHLTPNPIRVDRSKSTATDTTTVATNRSHVAQKRCPKCGRIHEG